MNFRAKSVSMNLLVVFSYLPHRFDMIEVGRKSFFITCFRLPKSQVGKEAAEELVGSFGASTVVYEMRSFHG